MKTLSLIQGSQEWLAHRATHFNASDAPAMMGVSPYKTRSQLLHEMATGISQEVDAATQRRFDDGHRFEALARPCAEHIIGQDLYPVTGSHGRYSASFDGLTMDETICFEHKTLNDEIRAIEDSTHAIPTVYQIQMEQQLMISGASKCLFMATKWDSDDTLVESKHVWYMPDDDLRNRIIAGWEQFEKDLAAYVPREVVEKPQAEAVMALPALLITAKGEVTSTNMPAFKDAARTFLANINRDLETDQQFADAKESAKVLRETAVKLKAKKEEMLEQTASIGEVAREIDVIVDTFNKTALALEKDVKEKELSIKADIANAAKVAYAAHVASLEAEISPIRLVLHVPDFAGAMKNQRTIASLHDKVDGALANARIEADAMAKDVRQKLTWFNATDSEYRALFPDLQTIIQKSADDFRLLVDSRITQHKQAQAAKEEAARARIQAEEQAKAEAKVKAERDARVNEESPPAAVEQAKSAPAATSTTTPFKPAEVSKSAPAQHRPTDNQIIGHLAVHYSVSEQTARGWIMDFGKQQKAA